MRKLALSDDILMKIEKPARYIGGEVNAVTKNLADIDVRFAMCFPDVYEIGMSHLGIQILYHQFNLRDDVYCERVYSPWPDLHKIMKEQDIPLFAADPALLEALHTGEYTNHQVEDIHRRHQLAEKTMRAFLSGNFDSDTRWDMIEEYFLGRSFLKPEEIAEK